MNGPASRPSQPVPAELSALIEDARLTLGSDEFWLFGSRARGDARLDSDWDLLAVLPDEAPDELVDPILTWRLRYRHAPAVTLLATRRSDLHSIWGLPNTLGYDLAHDGIRLRVG